MVGWGRCTLGEIVLDGSACQDGSAAAPKIHERLHCGVEMLGLQAMALIADEEVNHPLQKAAVLPDVLIRGNQDPPLHAALECCDLQKPDLTHRRSVIRFSHVKLFGPCEQSGLWDARKDGGIPALQLLSQAGAPNRLPSPCPATF